jgi:hypothetical protein
MSPKGFNNGLSWREFFNSTAAGEQETCSVKAEDLPLFSCVPVNFSAVFHSSIAVLSNFEKSA